MDFSALPPEINSARMYAGPGPGSLIAAASAWSTLSTELSAAATEYGSVVTSLASTWSGPSSTAMQAAAQPYIAWLTSTAEHAAQASAAASAAVEAWSAAFAATVPPPLIAANRAQLTTLVVTNWFGQNSTAIAANEAQYAAMWAQDAAAMNGYASSASIATAQLPTFQAAPQATSGSAPRADAAPVGLGGILDDLFGNGTTVGQNWQALVSSGFPINVAQLFGNFIGYWAVAAATTMAANAHAAVTVPETPVVVPPSTSAPVEAPTVSASSGTANQLGRLSVPPSWARPVEGRAAAVTVTNPTQSRFQAVIPVPPAIPVVTAGRSAQRKMREDPDYGHVSKVLPPRHPAGG